ADYAARPGTAATGRADRLVRVGREVLGHEVDEAAFLLEESEETERLGARRLGGRRGRRRDRLPRGRRRPPRGQERDHQRQRERCAEAPGERLVGDEEEVPRGDRRREHEPEEETSEDHARLAITRRGGKHATPACIAS